MTDKPSVLIVDGVTRKKNRVSRNVESVTKGALLLPLNDRAALRDKLIESVTAEIQALKDQAAQAEKLLG